MLQKCHHQITIHGKYSFELKSVIAKYFIYGNDFHSNFSGHNHTSACNDNVTFGRRDYNQLDFLYLNDLDRSEAETTTEL